MGSFFVLLTPCVCSLETVKQELRAIDLSLHSCPSSRIWKKRVLVAAKSGHIANLLFAVTAR
jgi:hypothetical protein